MCGIQQMTAIADTQMHCSLGQGRGRVHILRLWLHIILTSRVLITWGIQGN